MIKVRATNASKVYNKALKEFHRIVNEGEEFELSEERFKYLNGNNKFGAVFVVAVEEPIEKPVEVKYEPVEEIFVEEVKEEAEPIEEVPIDKLVMEEVPAEPKKKRAQKASK